MQETKTKTKIKAKTKSQPKGKLIAMECVEGVRKSGPTPAPKVYSQLLHFLFRKSDPTALAIFRFLFGFLMFLDVPQERGLEEADLRFGDPNYCFFPLFSFIEPLRLSHACIIYSVMWLGSVGMMLGIRFRSSCLLYLIPYLYFLLLDKSRWNNHSYLFALIVILMSGSEAGNYLSVDSFLSRKKSVDVPRWNYLMLKFQFFLLYFFAAVKKFDSDWLAGYSMRNLTMHWVFDPIKLILSSENIEYYMIHLGGLTYDLTVGFMLNIPCTKKLAFLLSFMFHGLNSQIFTIGMFPYVCLASLVLFCEPHEFPCKLFLPKNQRPHSKSDSKTCCEETEEDQDQLQYNDKVKELPISSPTLTESEKVCQELLDLGGNSPPEKESEKDKTSIQQETKSERRCWKVALMLVYVSIQLLLPFSHSITKGYNNWTEGLYGYSWDMMVYSWNTLHVKVTVVDTRTGKERYLDPDVWVTNDRWSSHADMAKQYSNCVARNLASFDASQKVAVHLDVWKSLNGRFQQRVFDPRVNILEAPWSPWEKVSWVLPLLKEYSSWRKERFEGISKNVANWTASSNVIFVADYPGLFLENYLPPELANVSVTLMQGDIVIEQPRAGRSGQMHNVTLSDSTPNFQSLPILTGGFHRIYTVSPTPSCYMYTYTNSTLDRHSREEQNSARNKTLSPGSNPEDPELTVYGILQDFVEEKLEVFSRSFYLIFNAYLNVFFDIPMIVRRAV